MNRRTALVWALATLVGCQDEERRRRPEDIVIAHVDGADVTRGAWEAYLRYSIHLPDEPLAAAGEREFPPEVKSRILDRFLIERALVARAGGSAEVPDSDLEKLTQETGLGSMAEIYESMPITQRDYVKSYLRDSVVVKRAVDDESNAAVKVSDEDIRVYFEENPGRFDRQTVYRLRTIRLESLRDSEEVQEEIGGDPAKFAETATRLSTEEDEQGRTLGGWTLDRMPEPFAAVIAPLEKGQVSAVALDPDGGYNLFLVEDKIEGGPVGLDQVHDRIRNHLLRERHYQKTREIIAEIEKTTKIEILPENLDFEYSKPAEANTTPSPASSSSGGA